MTVKELIEKLEKFEDDSYIVSRGIYCHFVELHTVEIIEYLKYCSETDNYKQAKGVLIT